MEFKSIPNPTNQTHKRIPNPPKSKSLYEIQSIPFRNMELDGIGIHRKNLTMKELEWNLMEEEEILSRILPNCSIYITVSSLSCMLFIYIAVQCFEA